MKKRSGVLNFILMLASLFVIFPAGIFSTQTKIEEISHYTSNVVKNNTQSNGLLSLIVKQNQTSGALPIHDSEFYNLYGTFKQQSITFASTINADKNHDLKLMYDNKEISETLSMHYYGPMGTVEYKGFYKHYIYPLQLMFPDDKASYKVKSYVINISQTHANNILKAKGLIPDKDGNFTINEYSSLIRTICQMKNGTSVEDFCINNIYLETNYYYEGLKETINDFIMVSYYLPWNLRAEQENCYFFNTDAFQNRYFMNYINDVYGLGKYDISINLNNVIKEFDVNHVLEFNTKVESNLNWLSILLFVIAIVLILTTAIGYTIFNTDSILKTILKLFVLIVPYLVFLIIYLVTNNVFLYSLVSCEIYLFVLLGVVFIVLMGRYIKKRVETKRKESDLNEVIV